MKLPFLAFALSALVFACSPLDGGGGGGTTPVEKAEIPEAAVNPAILGTQPSNGATDVDKTEPIVIAFDEPIDAKSLGSQTVRVFKSSDGPAGAVPGTVSYDALTQSVVFDPISDLEEVTEYSAEIEEGIQSASGGALAAGYAWTFQTKDQTPPAVVFSVPAPNAINVEPYEPITIVFHEALNPGSVSMKTSQTGPGSVFFAYQDDLSAALPGTLELDPTGTTVRFFPGVQLKPASASLAQLGYNLSVFGVEDLAGNGMTATFSLPFKIKDYLYVSSSSPAKDATGVPLDANITVGFSQAVNPATVNVGTFQVSGGVQTGTPIFLSSGDKFATFVPSQIFAPFTKYFVTLDASISNTFGQSLIVPTSFSFTTGDSITDWDTATTLETELSGIEASSYQLAQAANGDSFAIWVKGGGVFASRMPFGGIWSALTQLNQSSDGPAVSGPAIAADANGNALAAWISGGGASNASVLTLKFTPLAGWQSPSARVAISSTSFPAIAPVRISMNAGGSALLAWRRVNAAGAPGNQINLRGRAFFPNVNFFQGTFNSEQPAQGNQTLDADNIQVAIEGGAGNTNGWTVWTVKSPDSGKHLFAHQCGAGSWPSNKVTHPNLDNLSQDIAPNSLRLAVEPVMAGKPILVWSQGPLGARSIYSRRLGLLSFGPITALESQANDAQFPQISLGASSPFDAIVAWQQSESGGAPNAIYYNKYTGASGSWLAAGVKLTDHDPAEASLPAISFTDPLGSVVAVWREKTSPASPWQIYARRLSGLSASWGVPVNLCADTSNGADPLQGISPALECQPNRNPVAIWDQTGNPGIALWTSAFR